MTYFNIFIPIKTPINLFFVLNFELFISAALLHCTDSSRSHLPTQLISGAVVLQAEAVGLASPFLPFHILFIRTRWDNSFPPALPTQSVRAGTEEQSEAVLLWHTLQEAPQGFVAFLPVAAVVRGGYSLGTGYNIFRPQGSTFLIQAAVLSSFQALVLAVVGKS